jgi:uroporphyrinogen-III decarboxylase
MTNQERPTQIVIELRYDEKGMLDSFHAINQLEAALDGKVCITDSIDERFIAQDYPHLSAEERKDVISHISTGDYDTAVIDAYARSNYLDDLVEKAGYDVGTYEETNKGDETVPTY